MLNKQGHRWPAEWEQQAATWISWPHNRETWPGRFDPIPEAFACWIRQLSRFQPVHVLYGTEDASPSAPEMVGGLDNVHLHQLATNDVWIRDYGPTFVVRSSDGATIGVDWHFNAWGGKYPPFDLDAAAATTICELAGCQRYASTLFCEGGAIETDGLGTLMTTSSVLLSRTRNPRWDKGDVQAELTNALGATHFIWVDGGALEGDDTDGHIDQLARFVAPQVVVAAVSSLATDSNYRGLMENLEILKSAHDALGRSLTVHPLPTPMPRWVDGKRVPESYCNFLIANGALIVPTFRSTQTDDYAIQLLGQLMPDRQVIPLDAYDLIWGLGAFHCASQHQPLSKVPVSKSS